MEEFSSRRQTHLGADRTARRASSRRSTGTRRTRGRSGTLRQWANHASRRAKHGEPLDLAGAGAAMGGAGARQRRGRAGAGHARASRPGAARERAGAELARAEADLGADAGAGSAT